MVFRYNSEETAIAARERIATAEGFPNNGETLYYLNYTEYSGSFYIDARNDIQKDWYSYEMLQCAEKLIDLPTITDTLL